MDQRPPASAYAAAVGMTFAFGLSFVATKTALKGFEPLLLALLRFTLAGGILWVVWRLRPVREQLTRRELGRLALVGFVSLTVYFSFENTGIARTSASEAAILIATIPIFVALLGASSRRRARDAAASGPASCSRSPASSCWCSPPAAPGAARSPGTCWCSPPRSPPPSTASWRGACSSAAPRCSSPPGRTCSARSSWRRWRSSRRWSLGVRRPTAEAAGGVLFLTLVCSIVAYLLLNYAFRFLPAEPGERVHQPHADRGGRERLRPARRAADRARRRRPRSWWWRACG